MPKSTLRLLVSLALTGALLAWFFWNVDVARAVAALQEAGLGWLALSTALVLLGYWMRAIRWVLILRPVARVRHSSAVLTSAVGYAALAVLPARMGEIIRPVLLARRERFPISASLASTLVERLLDLWMVLVFLLAFVIWPPVMELDEGAGTSLRLLTRAGYGIAGGLVVGTLVLLGLLRYQGRVVGIFSALVGRIRASWKPRAAAVLNHLLDGLGILRRPRDLLATAVVSLLLWIVVYLQLHVLLRAFSSALPFRVTFLLVALAIVGLALPTPGGVGGFHKAIQLGLTVFFAVDLDRATAIAIAYHAVLFLPITVIGLLCMPALGLSRREMEAMAGGGAEEAADPARSVAKPGESEEGDPDDLG